MVRMKSSKKGRTRAGMSRFVRDYGMLGVLLLLCVLFSVLTLHEQYPTGTQAAAALAEKLPSIAPKGCGVLIVVRGSHEDSLFVASLKQKIEESGYAIRGIISGDPEAVRAALTAYADLADQVQLIATTQPYIPILQAMRKEIEAFQKTVTVGPPSHRWPTFLLPDNIRNVANQITVIAIIAIGMTMVIISGGIDLSVGSLIALSAVVIAWLIELFGGETAGAGAMILAGAAAILVCGTSGAFSGLMITRFRIPPFIATLAIMQVAAGAGYIISQGKPIYHLPESFIWLGRGAEPILEIPYAVILMVALYIIAHIVMTRTTLGRYIYAVGGNMEAARLSGIRVKLILFIVYTVCGMLAGLGGIIMASQLKSGAPTYGLTYELYVIAAVVVGGTSLSGGEGRVFGTLIGAFVIAVIQNGMNLTNVESYTQKVILGVVILGAVLLDRLKQQGFRLKKI
jgi:ribose/xylose/arabinose/galactoside ABC-type transport system permease subunit